MPPTLCHTHILHGGAPQCSYERPQQEPTYPSLLWGQPSWCLIWDLMNTRNLLSAWSWTFQWLYMFERNFCPPWYDVWSGLLQQAKQCVGGHWNYWRAIHWQYPENHSKERNTWFFTFTQKSVIRPVFCYLKKKAEVDRERIAYSHCINPTHWLWGSFPYSLIHLLLRLPRPGIAAKHAGLQRMSLWGKLSKTCHNQEFMFSQEGWPAPCAWGCKHLP